MKKTYLLAALGIGILVVSATSVAFAANNNYGAWRTMMGNNGGRAASAVTEKNFDQFNKMHELMAGGDYAGAQKIRADLGLGQGRGNGGGCPMRNSGAGRGVNFVDANNNGICDRLEQPAK